MDFSEALGYSFKGQNIPKILTIALIFVIVGVSIIVAALALESVAVLLLAIPILFAYALFISGYTISVIRAVMDGEDSLPEFELGRNIGRGFVVLIASFVYMIPIMIVFACTFFITGAMAGTSSQFDNPSGGSIAMLCVGMIIATIIAFGISYSLIVGQIRYAVEDNVGGLFDIGNNFGTVMSNMGTTFGLLLRQFGLAIVFGIVSSILSSIISGFFSGTLSDLMRINDPQDLVSMGMPLALFFSLYYVITISINLMVTFGGAHLIAGYGTELGLGGKSKNKYDTF